MFPSAWKRSSFVGLCFRNILKLFAILLSLAPACWAQLPPAGDTTSPPTPGIGHDFVHAPAETVNPANGSVSIRIPVRIPSGRELTIPLSIAYDSSGAFYYGSGGASPSYLSIINVPFEQGGWSYTFPFMTYKEVGWTHQGINGGRAYPCNEGTNYVFQDPTGNRHNLGLLAAPPGPGNQTCGSGILQGGDGPILATLASNLYLPDVAVTDGNGTVYSFSGATLPSTITDRNGNYISISSTGSSATVTDTADRSALSVGSFGGSPDDITVKGLSSPYQVSWTTASASFTISVDNLPGSAACPTSLSNSAKVVSQVVLPNGQKYSFDYSTNSYGMLDKITYPSGGYVRYVWGLNSQSEAGQWPQGTTGAWDCRYDTPAITDRYVSFDGSTEVLHQHFAYNTTWESGSIDYASKTTTVTTYDLVRGTNFNTVYTYTPFGAPIPPIVAGSGSSPIVTQQMPYEETIQYYATNGSLLRTVTKGWSLLASVNDRPIVASQQTTLNDISPNVSSLTIYCYNTSEEVTETDSYDLGTSAITPPSCSNGVPSGTVAGPLLRRTDTTYASFSNTNIVDLPSSVITYNGSGTRVAETDSSYDQTTPSTTSEVQHTTAPGGSARGNLTTVTKQCFNGTCSGGNAITKYSYYDTGQIYQMTDPNSNVSTFSYTDSYSSCSGNGPPSGSTNAYLTQVTYPVTGGVNHVESYCYDYLAGLLRGSTDENSQTTLYTYADSLDRLTKAAYPDGGETLVSYNDTPPTPSVTVEKEQTSGNFVTNITVTDGIGLPTETELTSDPSGTDLTTTAYDGLGHKYTETNPYHTTSDPTYGLTTYTYDALDRTTQVNDADGSIVGTVYSGNCTTVTDEASKNRESCTDGLGRVTSVVENPGGLGYTTSYTYDALGNLLSVVQNSSRQRNFSYDSLSRLAQSVNPESGTINYTYDANGNLISRVAPLENQTGSSTVTTSYAYDALNRLTSKTYSDGTIPAYFYYDQTTWNSHTLSNPIGRLTSLGTYNGSTWTTQSGESYDSMGRVLSDWQCTPLNCTLGVVNTYDLAGDLTTYTLEGPSPAPVTFTQTFNTAQDITEITSSLIDSQHPGTLAVFNTYTPFGDATSTTYGNGLTEATAYNNRLQICRANMNSSGTALSTCTSSIPSGNLLDLNYGFNAGATDNGDVMGMTATGNQTFNRSYTYDALNRIGSMSDSDSVASCQGLTWGYDAWANRTAQTTTKGSCGQWSSGYTANNQISGYSYDAAGNLLSDGVHTYTYDGENRIVSVDSGSTATYVYDANGRRASKTTGGVESDYVYGPSGEVFGILGGGCGTSCWDSAWIYAHGRLIAEYINSTTYFMQTDHLGSTRLMTAMNQSINDSMDFLPFGEQIQGGTGTTHKFTGKERDSETNLDDFGARYYSSQLGRFMSVDWSAVPAPVPYAHLTNPQTLNLYAIVSDNPETFADLDGHQCTIGPSGSQDCKPDAPNPNAPATPGEGQNTPGTGPSTTQNAQTSAEQIAALSNHFSDGHVDLSRAVELNLFDLADKASTALDKAAVPEVGVSGNVGPVGADDKGGVSVQPTVDTGVSVDFKFGAPPASQTAGEVHTGAGKHLSFGTNLRTDGKFQGLNVSVGPSVGGPFGGSVGVGTVKSLLGVVARAMTQVGSLPPEHP